MLSYNKIVLDAYFLSVTHFSRNISSTYLVYLVLSMLHFCYFSYTFTVTYFCIRSIPVQQRKIDPSYPTHHYEYLMQPAQENKIKIKKCKYVCMFLHHSSEMFSMYTCGINLDITFPCPIEKCWCSTLLCT